MKKIITILIIVLLFNTVYATVNIQENSADTLVKMGFLKGYPDGTLKLENNITRAEFCSLLVRMVGKEAKPESNKFSDITEAHWAYGVINRAAELGYINGYTDGTFQPSNNITYAESCSMLIKLLGYKEELEGSWPDNVMNKAKELKLNNNLEELESSHKMTRGEVSVMLINSMDVKVKGEI